MITRRDLIGGLFFVASAPLLAGLQAPGPAAVAARGLFRARRLEALRPRLCPGTRLEAGATEGEREVRTSAGAHLSLNETAFEILSRCDGSRSVSEIADELALLYEVPKPRLRPQVADTITSLLRAGVVA